MQLIDQMLAHPILINRPIVVTPWGVKLCRPSEAVLDILPLPQKGSVCQSRRRTGHRRERASRTLISHPAEPRPPEI